MRIDLNADVGEGASDEALFPYVSSVNIACGWHAGDAGSMHRTVAAAARHRLAIGAHPSFPDRAGFGRQTMHMSHAAMYAAVGYQIRSLIGIARTSGATVRHVKPHGALYNLAARDLSLAETVVRAVQAVDPSLSLTGLANSAMETAALQAGIPFLAEGFADRRYCMDGSLTPRDRPAAIIVDPEAAVAQALDLVLHGGVDAIDGRRVAVRIDTLCLHGDSPQALTFAERIHTAFRQAGIHVAAA